MSDPSTATPPAEVLSATGLHRAYGGRSVLSGVSLTLRAGERLALTGPSGSGKTTLLNCLGGIDRPDAGRVRLLGRELTGLDGDTLAGVRRRHIGTVFQFFHLLPTLTAAENVEFPLQLLGQPPGERRQRVAELLERVGVAHRAAALPGELSGGEMQRVAIARALVHRPELLLADEPTGNLDTRTGEEIIEILKDLNKNNGVTVICSTHDPKMLEASARVCWIEDGRIKKVTSPDEVNLHE